MKVKVCRAVLYLICSFIFVFLILSPWQEPGDLFISDNLLETSNNESLESVFNGYVIENRGFCDSRANLAIIGIVHSAVSHFEFRAVLRELSAAELIGLKLLFLLGQPRDKGLQEAVRQESDNFGDIVVGNFHDTYHNLTVKHLMGLTWVATHCRRAQFVLKLDDDIFVNYPLLDRFLKERYPLSQDTLVTRTGQRLIAGFVQNKMKVIRDPSNKWFVSEKLFPRAFYEDFCSGWAYLTTVDTIDGLLQQVTKRRLLWVDDAFVTGELRASSKDIALERLNKWYNLDAEYLQKWLSVGASEAQRWPFLFSNANGEVDLLRDALKASRECSALGVLCKCCFPVAANQIRNAKRQPSGRGSFERVRL